MTNRTIEATSLWCTAFSTRNLADHKDECARLHTEFLKFRDKIDLLVRKISEVLPGLTIHDLSHLDALWQTASLIAGPDYPLNPLEAFTFGSAVLLHDSAMCWEAYTNGREGVRADLVWKDAYAVEIERAPDADDSERRLAADFSALRALHARQASKLPEMAWIHPDTDSPIYLIDDFQLRTHLGHLIGKIASSHHWNSDVLAAKLGNQVNAPAQFPGEWSIDPVKIACLLRCADAAHVNQSRAPDFLHALIRRNGVSRSHWQAQNRMLGPTLDAGDETNESILYTSSRPYDIDAADAWWIAYDAARVVNTEIADSNALLKDRKRTSTAPEFKVKRVQGVSSADEMAQLLHVHDWKPCSAQIHVSNIEALVKNLGGEKLYGEGIEKTEVVIRELIQNSRDAIVARQYVESMYRGNIAISLKIINSEPWLYIEDDGVGMSYEVLTGALLDFGNSFWKSALIQTEFPGLRSSGFKSVGQFGIGFYSVFMIADAVTIVSKRWDKGLDEANTLIFGKGLSLRPIVQHGRPVDFHARTSTQVRVKIKSGLFQSDHSIQIRSGLSGVPDFNVPVHDFIAAVVAGLDIDVSYESPSVPRKLIHEARTEFVTGTERFLEQLSLAHHQSDKVESLQYIKENHQRLRPINVDGRVVGFAAISTSPQSSQYRLGLRTIGGLAVSVQGGGSSEFIGYMNYRPRSAKRDATEIEIPRDILNTWYIEQLEILSSSVFSDMERCVVASNACSLGLDPYSVGRIYILRDLFGDFVSYLQLASMAETTPVVIYKSVSLNFADTYNNHTAPAGKILIRPLTNGANISLELKNGTPSNPNSIIGCLHRAVLAKGRVPVWTIVPSSKSSIFGPLEELTLSSNPVD